MLAQVAAEFQVVLDAADHLAAAAYAAGDWLVGEALLNALRPLLALSWIVLFGNQFGTPDVRSASANDLLMSSKPPPERRAKNRVTVKVGSSAISRLALARAPSTSPETPCAITKAR